jgi:hypothetical protein
MHTETCTLLLPEATISITLFKRFYLSLTSLGMNVSFLHKPFTGALLDGRRRIISNLVNRNTCSREGLDCGGSIGTMLLKEGVHVVANGIANRVRNHDTALVIHENRARQRATDAGSVPLAHSSSTAVTCAAAKLHH